jgi:hypothetical protein
MTSTDTLNPTPERPTAGHRFSTIGTDAPAADSRPVGADDRAVIGVFADLDSAQAAVERLTEAGELRERLLLPGFIKIDRKGLLKSDAYAAADEIGRVQDGSVHLAVTEKAMLEEAGI